jgi:hypothetical protein
MTKAERALLNKMYNNMDAFERDNADAPIVQSPEVGLANQAGNPKFRAQFDVQILLRYFSVAAGVYTAVLPAALPAPLRQRQAAFLFGNSDFASGFARVKQAFPLTNWNYDAPFIFGTGANPTINAIGIDANVRAILQPGDLVITSFGVSGGNFVALTILRCTQVAYGTLLDALNSDRFAVNNIRYVIDTVAFGQNQFANNIYVTNQSLFGKFESDFVSPNSFKKPEQFQNGIIDVPLETGVDKQKGIATYCEFDTTTFLWSVFVRSFSKLQA